MVKRSARVFPFQVQLVHWNTRLYDSIEEAVGRPNGIVIVTLFTQVSLVFCLQNSAWRKQKKPFAALISRLKVNATKTKFSKNVNCVCGETISPQHIIYNYRVLKAILPPIPQMSLKDFFSDQLLVVAVVVKIFPFEPCVLFSVNCMYTYMCVDVV